jgi:hypothetical protein
MKIKVITNKQKPIWILVEDSDNIFINDNPNWDKNWQEMQKMLKEKIQ